MSDLRNVQVGDAVATYSSGIGGTQGVRKRVVARVTQTQVVMTDGSRWLKRTGSRVGDSEWSRAYATPWTPEHDALNQRVLAERVVMVKRDALRNIAWRAADDSQVEKAHAYLVQLGVLKEVS